MSDPPPFDPNRPFTTAPLQPPPFDPNQPYTNPALLTAPGGYSVNTTGMSPEDRATAQAALDLRAKGEVPGVRLVPRTERPAFNAFTLGYGDEAISGVHAGLEWLKGNSFQDAYRQAQEAQRQELAQEREEHPTRSTVTSIIGGALPATRLARGATWLAETLPGIRSLPAASALWGRVGYGAGQGAAYGAVQGAGEGSGFYDRLKEAATGAGLGATAGALAAPVADAVSGLYRAVADRAAVSRNLGDLGLGRRAADNIVRAGAADNAFAGPGRAAIQAAGPDAMVADAGATTRGLLDMVTQRTGAATGEANLAVGGRMARANQNVRGALDNALGQPSGLDSTVRQIREASEAARDQAYTAFHNAPVNYAHPRASELDAALLHVPNRGGISDTANELMTLWEGPAARSIGLDAGGRFAGSGGLDRFGREVFDQRLTSQQLDYLTRALRQHESETLGALGGMTDKSAGYAGAAGRIRGIMRDIVPESGAAWDAAADPISRIAATKAGATALSPNTTRDQVREAMRNMQPGERQAFAQAVRTHIDDQMANVRWAASRPDYDAKQLSETLGRLNSQQAREKLTEIIGDPAQVDRLMTELGHASSAAELSAAMARNSATFSRGEIANIDKQLAEPGAFGRFFRGQPVQAGQSAWQRLWGTRPQDELRGRDLSDLQIARALTGHRGPDALDLMQRLTQAYDAGTANQARQEAVRRQVSDAGRLTSYWALPGLLDQLGLPSPR